MAIGFGWRYCRLLLVRGSLFEHVYRSKHHCPFDEYVNDQAMIEVLKKVYFFS